MGPRAYLFYLTGVMIMAYMAYEDWRKMTVPLWTQGLLFINTLLYRFSFGLTYGPAQRTEFVFLVLGLALLFFFRTMGGADLLLLVQLFLFFPSLRVLFYMILWANGLLLLYWLARGGGWKGRLPYIPFLCVGFLVVSLPRLLGF